MAFAVAVPDTYEVIVGEQLDLEVDFAGVLGESDTLFLPRITVFNLNGNEEVSAFAIEYGSVVLSGTVMSFTLLTDDLRPKTDYQANFICSVLKVGEVIAGTVAPETPVVVHPSSVTWSTGDHSVITVQLVIKVIY